MSAPFGRPLCRSVSAGLVPERGGYFKRNHQTGHEIKHIDGLNLYHPPLRTIKCSKKDMGIPRINLFY